MNTEVLVVDDDTISANALMMQLEKIGIKSDVASTGREALKKVTEKNYRLIFMDIAMPDMDGYAAAIAIRASSLADEQSIGIIAVTSALDRQRCIDSGMDDALIKPVQIDQLGPIVERYLKST